ncbi:hypothetical protein PG994_012713 [Apiospora phragmitis]|uniref:Uncharacterized protein n=1 Tax=Apiospora phragmitis TaxID=2905665 RepID=A0ABR1TB90_9PEZI
MAYSDDFNSGVRTISTVWIVVIVVLVVFSVGGLIVAIWLWRRHVSRRNKRMEAFYAAPIQAGPSQQQQQLPQQYPNYNYQQKPQEAPTSSPLPRAQLDAQETGVSNNNRTNYTNRNGYNTQTRSELYG